MVLINSLTIDEINAALLHLQRSKDEVVGGVKGDTVQNVTINNKGGGSTVDYAPTIELLSERIDKNAEDIENVDKEIDKIKNALEGLASNGVVSLTFDNITRNLTLYTEENEYTVTITSDAVTLSFDDITNKLTLTYGEDSYTVTFPYINANEKGVANGVATLDSSGRVPYSQLPESAMEFLGNWDASTNTPHLQDGTGTNGDFYVCNVGGTVTFGTGNTQTFVPNDRVIYNGASSQWVKLPAGQVSSVNGMSGDVTLTASDINYSQGVTIKDKIDANAVQANWSETDSSKLSFIQNKPTIPAAQIQSNWTQTDNTKKDYIKNKPTLATVATSGSYTDLSNKPTIPAAQVQADWTQTNSSQKDFIKNKIPIWITNGSADDNMSPVGVVEAGSTQPVTSGGVANALDVPTDAVLHYSFDEVPDYPDGTAVYFKNKDWTDLDSWTNFAGNGTVSVKNGILTSTRSANAIASFQRNMTLSNGTIIKLRLIDTSDSNVSFYRYSSGNWVYIGTISLKANTPIEHILTISANSSAFMLRNSEDVASSGKLQIQTIYIGDGSYSTPIIDNANGQNNATNNGGIAVQGVSGKGAYFPSATQQVVVPYKQHNSNNDLSISLWLKIPSSYNYSGESAVKAIFATGAYAGLFGFYRQGNEIGFISRDSTNFRQYGFTPDKNVWLSLVAVYSGSTHSFKLYVNGELKATSAGNLANYLFGGNTWYIWGNAGRGGSAVTLSDQPAYIDDLLIFDRALSETEVQALYLNKANTPKYYSWADWKLSQL